MNKILAIDLGASSGRAILGILDQQKRLHLEEVYRFPNGGVQVGDELHWDVPYLFNEIKTSLKSYAEKYGSELSSIGIDTWGVNFVLLDENDRFLSPMYHYRDKRTIGMLNEMFKIASKEDIFQQTGIQFMELNSSTQLFSMVKHNSSRLKKTHTFFMFPDYLNFLLSGKKSCEFSDATTTQLYNPVEKEWAWDLITDLGLNPEWFMDIIPGGTVLGTIQKELAEEVGLRNDTKIISPLTHDTGSAYASVPVEMNLYKEGEYGVLSSGTWSLLGVELQQPLISEKALKYNYTNEGGINGTIRFLKNITGLWLIQECKKIWEKDNKDLSWDIIEEEARKARPFKFFINPDDPDFVNPSHMVQAIQDYCKQSHQDIPQTIGEIARTIFESLAFRYKQAVENLEEIIDRKLRILHIIGGGSQNRLLNQFTTNALNIPVKAGPSEATAIGNILVQALALGLISNVAELRQIVRKSFKIIEYLPQNAKKWEEEYQRFINLFR